MDARLQRRVQRYGWDKAQAHYESYWARQLRPAQERLLEMARLQSGESVVDIAAGTGLVTFPAAEAVGPKGRVVATDLSDKMVETLRDGAAERSLPNVSAERMDAEELKLGDGEFDVALDALGLMYTPDWDKAIAEMHRVLRPGGRAVAAVWGARKNCGWAEIFPIVEARVKSDVCPLFFMLGNGSALADAFGRAGFDAVTEDRLSVTLDYAGADDALGAAFAGGPVALAYSRFDDEMREGAHADYLESIADYKEGAGYKIPGEFVVVAGVRAG